MVPAAGTYETARPVTVCSTVHTNVRWREEAKFQHNVIKVDDVIKANDVTIIACLV